MASTPSSAANADSPSPPSNLRETMEATTRDFLKSNEIAALMADASVVTRCLDPECQRIIVPRSFMDGVQGTTEGPERIFSNTQAEVAFEENSIVSRVTQTTILDMTIDEAARRTAARTVTVLRFRDGEEITLENSWFLELVEDGRRIRRIVEFCGEENARKRVEKTVGLLMKRAAQHGCDTLGILIARGEVELSGSVYDGLRADSMLRRL